MVHFARDRGEVRQTGHDVHISQHAVALCALHSVSSTSNIHRSSTAAPSPGWFSRCVACVCIDWHNRGLTAYIRRLQYRGILKRLSPHIQDALKFPVKFDDGLFRSFALGLSGKSFSSKRLLNLNFIVAKMLAKGR